MRMCDFSACGPDDDLASESQATQFSSNNPHIAYINTASEIVKREVSASHLRSEEFDDISPICEFKGSESRE